jgi:hypothetical protein
MSVQPLWSVGAKEHKMSSAVSMVRRSSWVLAATLIGATILYVGLAFDVFGGPAALPDSADFIERILATNDFERSVWPISVLSSLLFVVALATVVAIAASLRGFAAGDDSRARTGTWLLVAGATLGISAQLISLGALRIVVDVAYCDCGYRNEEIISQTWALFLVQGGSDWVLYGAEVLLGLGIALVGAAFGETVSSGWRAWAFLTGLVLAGAGVAQALVPGLVADLLLAVASGVLVPVWAIWLGRGTGAADPASTSGQEV